MAKLTYDEIMKLVERISRPEPEVEEEDIRVSAKDLWML